MTDKPQTAEEWFDQIEFIANERPDEELLAAIKEIQDEAKREAYEECANLDVYIDNVQHTEATEELSYCAAAVAAYRDAIRRLQQPTKGEP